MRSAVWASIAGYVTVILFEVGTITGPALIATVTALTAVGVVPYVYRWAERPPSEVPPCTPGS